MQRFLPEQVLATALAAIFLALCHWQMPDYHLRPSAIDTCLASIDHLAPLPTEEKRAFIVHLRAWVKAPMAIQSTTST